MRRHPVLVACAVPVLLAGCSGSEPAPVPTVAPTAVPTPSEGVLTPGFDQEPDGERVPDASLSPADITGLLRIEATSRAGRDTCTGEQLSTVIDNLDAAAGHRYGRLLLTNTSDRPCSIEGYPGIGARGAWGNTLQLAAEQREPRDGVVTPGQVMLAPGDEAVADLEWTGELAGAESEKASMIAVQLGRGQDAFGIPAVAAVAADSGAQSGDSVPLDIGMLTTVRIGAVHQPPR
ncbi:MAG: DUF4232 domain-containing protein [Aeromicrobium sp.]